MINDVTKKRWLYYEAIKLLDYKWKQNINFKDKDVIYEGKEFPGLRELGEHGFLKNVSEPQPGWKYKIKGVDWWKLIKFAYGFFIDNSGLDQSEMYGDEKQVDVLYETTSKKSRDKGKDQIKITQKELLQHLKFIDIVSALEKAEHRGWINIKDFNISLPHHLGDTYHLDAKGVEVEVYLKIYDREAIYSLILEKQGALYLENRPEKNYKIDPESFRYNLLRKLAGQKTKEFVPTQELADDFDSKPKLVSKAIGDIRKKIEKLLNITGHEVIEGEKGKGYRINYKKCKIKLKKY